MPPRGQKRSYKIESMYYTLPTMKKKYCHQESSLHLCAQEGSRNISRSYFNFNCLKNKQTNKHTFLTLLLSISRELDKIRFDSLLSFFTPTL